MSRNGRLLFLWSVSLRGDTLGRGGSIASTTYTGAIENAYEFGRRIYTEAFERGWDRAKKKVVIGDGAEWIWNTAALHFPGAVEIVDLFHARQHLCELARLLYPNDEAQRKRWITRQQNKLDSGDNEKLAVRCAPSTPMLPNWPIRSGSRPTTSNATPPECVIPPFVHKACLSGPASSKPDAGPSSAAASNNRACSGPSAEPTPSFPFAAIRSVESSKTIGPPVHALPDCAQQKCRAPLRGPRAFA